jgi:hypothetical protein
VTQSCGAARTIIGTTALRVTATITIATAVIIIVTATRTPVGPTLSHIHLFTV